MLGFLLKTLWLIVKQIKYYLWEQDQIGEQILIKGNNDNDNNDNDKNIGDKFVVL